MFVALPPAVPYGVATAAILRRNKKMAPVDED
jgi:hypothetical protein